MCLGIEYERVGDMHRRANPDGDNHVMQQELGSSGAKHACLLLLLLFLDLSTTYHILAKSQT